MRYEKADTLLQLALEMQAARGGLSLADIESRFRVGRRTAMRMRDAVVRSFPQAEEVPAYDRIKRWRIPPGTLDRLLAFGADELAALEFAAKVLADQNRGDQAALLTSLTAKLKALMKPSVARRVEPDLEALLEAEGLAMRPGPKPRLDAAVIGDLRQAIKACRKTLIRYRNRRTKVVNDRLVHPYGFLHGHRHYLVAWHEHPKANAVALFSLPHIAGITLLDETFVREPQFDLSAFAARSFGLFQGEAPFEVVWRFAAHAAAEAAEFIFHPSQTLHWQDDGSLIVRFVAAGELEMAWHLYTWGDSVEVLAPQRLATLVHRHRESWPALP